MVERKPDDERLNRNPRVHPTTFIVWDGVTRGPELPEGEWADETIEFWQWLRNSPQAILFQDGDWMMMKTAIKVFNQMHSTKRVYDAKKAEVYDVPCTPGELKSLHAEWRASTDTYGFTRQSRNRYGINIITPEELENEAVQAQMAKAPVVLDYRKRLSS